MIVTSMYFGICDYCGKWIPKHDQEHWELKGPSDRVGPLITVVTCSLEHQAAFLALDQIAREQLVTTMINDVYANAEAAIKDSVDQWTLNKLREQYKNEDHNAEPA